MLRRVLIVWACEHARAGYKQGMSELLAVLLCQTFSEHRVWQHALRVPAGAAALEPPLSVLAALVDPRYVEHDAYWLLDAMMARLQGVYLPDEPPAPAATGTPVAAPLRGAGAGGDVASPVVPARLPAPLPVRAAAAAAAVPAPASGGGGGGGGGPAASTPPPRKVPKFRQWLHESPGRATPSPPPVSTPVRTPATARPRLMTPSLTDSSLVRRLDHIQGQLLARFDPALNRHLTDIGVEPSMYLLRWLRLVFARELAMVCHARPLLRAARVASLMPARARARTRRVPCGRCGTRYLRSHPPTSRLWTTCASRCCGSGVRRC